MSTRGSTRSDEIPYSIENERHQERSYHLLKSLLVMKVAKWRLSLLGTHGSGPYHCSWSLACWKISAIDLAANYDGSWCKQRNHACKELTAFLSLGRKITGNKWSHDLQRSAHALDLFLSIDERQRQEHWLIINKEQRVTLQYRWLKREANMSKIDYKLVQWVGIWKCNCNTKIKHINELHTLLFYHRWHECICS